MKKLPWLLIVGGLIAFLFSFLITFEKNIILSDPNHVTPCDINPFISCGTVMRTAQASVFGFPNSLLGIAGFAIVATIGFALLSGAQFKRWFWLGTQAGLTFAVGFIFWLFFQSVFRIGALCPYCMGVWTVTIPMFVYVTAYNFPRFAPYALATMLSLYGIIIASIVYQFWAFWVGMVT